MSHESYNQKRLIFLIGKIPNWEIHLTDKQLEATKLYISTFDTTLVDIKLNLKPSTAYKRIFGSSTIKGALGRLEEIYIKLDNIGFFNKTKQESKKQNTKPILSNKTLDKVKELFEIVSKMENYNEYLTDIQKDKLYKFLSLRSFKECAKYYNISESSFKQSLLGRDDTNGILGKLKTQYNQNHINNWNDI